jgi:hypothetical protein
MRSAYLVDPAGRTIAIASRLIIGRSRENDVVVHSGGVARRHLALIRLPSGEVEAEDLGSTNGTRLNGARLSHHVLTAGDVLELDDQRFVFQQGPLLPEQDEPAAVLLARAGDDEAAIKVAIDMLLEQGNPLGARLLSPERVPLPPGVESAVELGELELEWRHNFVHAARLRAHTGFHALREVLFALLSSEAARFLAALTLPEWNPRFGLENAPLPALRTLRFGPFFRPEDAARCRQALELVRFTRAPFLQPPELLHHTRAWLEFDGGQRRELEQGRQETFPTFVVRWEPGGWQALRVRQTPNLLLNGKSRFAGVLAPDDVVSSGGTRFTFRAS